MHDTPSDVLAANGPLAGLLQDYTPRPMQADMADCVAEAIGEHESLICEAGTGTGKTFAYLIPAVLSGKKIIISTGTRHLQDQIYEKDLPTVRKATAATVSVCVLKGRNNYLCLHRYKALASNPLQDSLMTELHSLQDWANSTRSGDVSEILTEASGLHEHITSTTENCLGQECDYYNDCHVLKARRRAQETDIVIVNHYLLLSDMALKEAGFGELLPRVDCIIFDEAHQLPELASQYLGVTVSSRQLQDLVSDAGKAFKNEAADIPGFLELLSTLEQATRSARAAFGQTDRRSDWTTVASDPRCREAAELIEERLQEIAETLKSQAQRGKQLDNCYKRAELLLDRLQSFLHDTENKMVTWLETRGRGFLLHQTPLNVAEAFQSRLNRYECSCIYTSATLTVNNRFEHFADQLGLDGISAHNWPSPYNFKQQSLLYLPAAMPAPNSPGFTDAVLEKSLPVLKASEGRAFLLFTSHRALRYAAELIRDRLPYRILVQGERSRGELLDEFRRDEHSILLGTNSFWEGVDVKGPALSCVIIDKLPFATPDDPVLKARSARMEDMGRNPFMEYQLPLAVIQLKQGIGRLIRDDRDRGVLMICDSRIREKSYGRVFIRSLPDITITDNIKDIEAFFAG